MKNNLLKWQKLCLFIAVAILPLQSPPFYKKTLGAISFMGAPSSFFIGLGLVLAILMCFRKENGKKHLLPVFIAFSLYILTLVVISCHGIANFHQFNASTFGMTPKLLVLKQVLLSLGITNEEFVYKVIVFAKDMRSCFIEVVYVFGFSIWIAFLYLRDRDGVFSIVQKAIICDFFLLAFYVALEVFHLYGVAGATQILKFINPFLYEPNVFLGWYPPVVSPNQVRGTWTEPAYFAIWLTFAVPFLIHRTFASTAFSWRSWFWRFALFYVVFSVWLMTYSRTSVVLIVAMIVCYSISLIFQKKKDFFCLSVLVVSFTVAMLTVANLGPAEITKWQGRGNLQTGASSLLIDSKKSAFIENTVMSTVDAKSRSNPVRIQGFVAELRVFADFPIFGCGESFLPWYKAEKLRSMPQNELTGEMKQRLTRQKKDGLLRPALDGFAYSISNTLASRGLVVFLLFAVPIAVVWIKLLVLSFHCGEEERDQAICILVPMSVMLMTALSQGLKFLSFWCLLGLALGYVLAKWRLK